MSRKAPKAASLVADDIRRRIAIGEFAEGDALPNESLLMEHYDVSRPTVRGALRILESESLLFVKMGPGGGPRVALPDAAALARQFSLQLQLRDTSLKDVFDARLLIEPAAVRALAQRKNKRIVRELRELHEQELVLVGEPEKFAAAAAEFHERVVELAGNQTLSLVARLLQHLVTTHNQSTLRHGGATTLAQRGMDDHEKMLALIEAGDADAAEAVWRRHMMEASEEALRAHGARSRLDLFRADPATKASRRKAPLKPLRATKP